MSMDLREIDAGAVFARAQADAAAESARLVKVKADETCAHHAAKVTEAQAIADRAETAAQAAEAAAAGADRSTTAGGGIGARNATITTTEG